MLINKDEIVRKPHSWETQQKLEKDFSERKEEPLKFKVGDWVKMNPLNSFDVAIVGPDNPVLKEYYRPKQICEIVKKDGAYIWKSRTGKWKPYRENEMRLATKAELKKDKLEYMYKK